MAARVLSWLPSITYPPAQDGRWSPITSTIDWCEENYYATEYVAEIINTFTNLLFVYLAAKGIHNCVKHGHDTVFIVSFIGYLLVGTGSLFFHASLKYPMQLVDELNMIYTTALMCYTSFSYSKSKLYSTFLAVSLVSLSVFITLYYHYLQDPTFHQITYAIMTIIVFFRSVYVMEVNIRPRFRSGEREAANPRSKSEQVREDARDQDIVHTMWTMIAWGLSIFLGGFGCWALDNVYCSIFRQWRRELGMPWGFLLEFHGWWHLMTGTGAYFYIVWGIWLRHCLNNSQDDYVLDWPAWYTFPAVVKKSKSDANGRANKHTNGNAKGFLNGDEKKEL